MPEALLAVEFEGFVLDSWQECGLTAMSKYSHDVLIQECETAQSAWLL